MAANNKVGNIYPIQDVGQISQNFEILFLYDACGELKMLEDFMLCNP
jgi:cysteine sulfinate desulfinase/cysteine desulfurase-like protein